VRCLTCERRCLVPEGGVGYCSTRRNMAGRLHTLVYGDISSASANPIEKKPFFHFHPGSTALTVGTWSCNFDCPWCQNHDISKSPGKIGTGRYLSPERLADLVAEWGCQGTSISFNEPTLLLEYSLDVFRLARERGYYNTYVTNGYMTPRALQLLVDSGLDAMNVDIKGGPATVREFCGADVEHVWRNVARAKGRGLWVEVTTLVIPRVNDSEAELSEIARRIQRELGDETPWHVTGYYPAYRFGGRTGAPSTPVSTLEAARDLGLSEGLKYVYVGNVPGHPYENTYCPACRHLLIERRGFGVPRYRLGADNRCPDCGQKVPVVGPAACGTAGGGVG